MITTDAHALYRRWLNELWAGQTAVAQEIEMFDQITFEIDVGPLAEGDPKDIVAEEASGPGCRRPGLSSLSEVRPTPVQRAATRSRP
jgi:hypothetical protein